VSSFLAQATGPRVISFSKASSVAFCFLACLRIMLQFFVDGEDDNILIRVWYVSDISIAPRHSVCFGYGSRSYADIVERFLYSCGRLTS